MNSTVMTVSRAPVRVVARIADYLELTKARIVVMVLAVVGLSMLVAQWGQVQPFAMFSAMLGTLLVAASASVWNQIIEHRTDQLMPRTATRPIPSGRISRSEAMVVGTGLGLLGAAYLLLTVGFAPALVGVVTWLGYVVGYTPLKRHTSWNTLVGAIPGAMPVLIGWTATGQPLDMRAATLFTLLFIWQFPHFMSIAWLYRGDYARAGLKMITVVDRTGQLAGIQAVAGAAAIIPVSLLPAWQSPTPLAYGCLAVSLGIWQLFVAIGFCRRRDERAAKRLLKVSVIYLPLILLAITLIPLL